MSSFEYFLLNGVPRWGSGKTQDDFMMLSREPRGASSVHVVSRRQRQSL